MSSIESCSLNLKAIGQQVSDLRILIRNLDRSKEARQAVHDKIARMILNENLAPFEKGLKQFQWQVIDFDTHRSASKTADLIKMLHNVFFANPFIKKMNAICDDVATCPHYRITQTREGIYDYKRIQKEKMDFNLCLVNVSGGTPKTVFEQACQHALAKKKTLYQTLEMLLMEGANPNDYIRVHPLASVLKNELLTPEEKTKLIQLMIDKGLDIKAFFSQFDYNVDWDDRLKCCDHAPKMSPEMLQLIFDNFEIDENDEAIKPFLEKICNCEKCLNFIPILIFNGIDVSKHEPPPKKAVYDPNLYSLGAGHSVKLQFLEARAEITRKALAIYQQAKKEFPPEEHSTLETLKKLEALKSFSFDLLRLFSQYITADMSRQAIAARCYELAKENPIAITETASKERESVKKKESSLEENTDMPPLEDIPVLLVHGQTFTGNQVYAQPITGIHWIPVDEVDEVD